MLQLKTEVAEVYRQLKELVNDLEGQRHDRPKVTVSSWEEEVRKEVMAFIIGWSSFQNNRPIKDIILKGGLTGPLPHSAESAYI